MGLGLINVDPGKILSGFGDVAVKIRTALTGVDPAVKGKIETLLAEFTGKAQLGQLAINEQEAKHPSLFVAGWRPFIGWVCGAALLYHYIVDRLIEWLVILIGWKVTRPEFDLYDLLVVLGGLLGLGGMRWREKVKGVARNTWRKKDDGSISG